MGLEGSLELWPAADVIAKSCNGRAALEQCPFAWFGPDRQHEQIEISCRKRLSEQERPLLRQPLVENIENPLIGSDRFIANTLLRTRLGSVVLSELGEIENRVDVRRHERQHRKIDRRIVAPGARA